MTKWSGTERRGVERNVARIMQIRRHQPYDIDNPILIMIAFLFVFEVFEVLKFFKNWLTTFTNYRELVLNCAKLDNPI